MARECIGILLVKVDTFTNHPKVFQDFVNNYFKQKIIFGVNFYFAFSVIRLDHSSRNSHPKGIVPRNISYLYQKVEGTGQKLFWWLDEKIKDVNQTDIFEISMPSDELTEYD